MKNKKKINLFKEKSLSVFFSEDIERISLLFLEKHCNFTEKMIYVVKRNSMNQFQKYLNENV